MLGWCGDLGIARSLEEEQILSVDEAGFDEAAVGSVQTQQE
jgi:hypothetical protein